MSEPLRTPAPPSAETPTSRGTRPVLEQSLAASYVPGTNLRQRFPRAGWVYLLPDLDLGDVLCIGVPAPLVLEAVARRARTVTVLCLTRRDLRKRDRIGRGGEAGRIAWRDGRVAWSPEPAAGLKLVLALGRDARRWLAGDAGRMEALRDSLGRGGAAYVEWRSFGRALPDGLRGTAALPGLASARIFRLLPVRGEAQLAVPDDDRRTLDALRRRGIARPRPWLSLRGPVGKLLRRLPALPDIGRRYGVLLGATATGHPPEYLCAVARRSGVTLENHRWGLSIPRGYQSRKIAFFLFGTPPIPSYVAKLPPDPAMNGRLENEARALRELESLGLADEGRVPRVAFFGEHAGLAILGQALIEGVPFLEKTAGGPECPHAATALETFHRLGGLQGGGRTAPGHVVAAALDALLEQFAEIYGDREAVAFLRQRVERLRSHPDPIPLVFQHGDAGAWNMLVTPAGQVAILDWEAAESDGMPLWDLCHFLRSYGVLDARRRGAAPGARARFARTFLGEDALGCWVREAIVRYCVTVGLAGSLAEPLFCLCWMHRAVKEAPRLEARDLSQGHYLSLLRVCMREQDSLRRLGSPAC
jgi:hypothetical protein